MGLMGAVLLSDHQTNFSTFWMLHVPLVREGGAPRTQLIIAPRSLSAGGTERRGAGAGCVCALSNRAGRGKGRGDGRRFCLINGRPTCMRAMQRTWIVSLGHYCWAEQEGRQGVRASTTFLCWREETGRAGIHLESSMDLRTQKEWITTSEQESDQRHIYIVGVLQDICL
jgi:hypothetical protein